MAETTVTESKRTLERHLAGHPHLVNRIYRQLLVELCNRGVITVDELYEKAHAAVPVDSGSGDLHSELTGGDPASAAIREYTSRHLSPCDIDEVVNLALKREEADTLRAILNLSNVSFRVVADKVRRFCALPVGTRQLDPGDAMGIRVGLIRHIVSDQLEFIGVAKHYLKIRDFDEIVARIIGPEHGIGRVGGKAAGMYLAYKILSGQSGPLSGGEEPTAPAGPPRPPLPVAIPESWFLRSDVIDEFLELNNLGEYQNQKYKTAEEIRAEYPVVCRVFRRGKFPQTIVERLRQLLETVGTHPLIVRSSSLLEDRFGTAFSGKYASVFLPNQGRPEQRLKELLAAIAEIYASALGPDPLLYRRRHNLIDYPEDVGVLIQKVVGTRFGDYFLPAFAGVAFSRNEYRWSPRIRREDGLLRLVMGLGTRAVDRVGGEYPRMVALTEPTLRCESTPQEVRRNAQRAVDAINLARNKFESVPIETLLSKGADFPMLDRIVSIARDGGLYAPTGTFIDAAPRELVVTFEKLLRSGDFAPMMREMLRRLEEAYRHPVDVEFAHDGQRLYILQCRVQTEPARQVGRIEVPQDVPAERSVFSARRFVRTGLVQGVEYVIYVDPHEYDAIPSREQRIAVGRTIGALNERLAERVFILVGPGRWGTNDLRLGVHVTYADIRHARMLIEVARERDGYVPEVSFGTHFFQDLIEDDILYLPLYPDDKLNCWNEAFFSGSANALAELLPDHAEQAGVVRVIHVPSVAAGRTLRIVMDGNEDRALAYLDDAPAGEPHRE